MGKNNRPLVVIILALIVLSILAYWQPRSKEETEFSWQAPTEKGRITARLSKDGQYGFVLTLEGEGTIKDLAGPEEAPWYGRSGRVTSIELSEGITGIGANSFTACCYVDTVLVPQSVARIGSGAFSENTAVCAYEGTEAAGEQRIYRHSEEHPVHAGYYWHMQNGKPVIWDLKKVLFIGNSFTYTYDIDRIFEELVNDAGMNVMAERITIGSYNVSKFADPSDPGGAMVETALTANSDYDIIVIQEQSTRPITNYNLFLDGVTKLKKRITETQKDCDIYLYATWGYPKRTETTGQTVPQMEAELRTAYANVGKALDLKVSPVGKAFSDVYVNHPEINLYEPDGQHPSYAGSYLSACVHAATLLGLDPRELGAENGSLTAETVKILKDAAYAAVFGK